MTDAKLKSLVERIERLMDERDGLGDDIRDVFTEVKSAGYVPKVLRKVIVRRRMDPSKRAEEDSWQEMYEAALDGPTRKALDMAASGATARQIEQETGIDQATVARSVSLKKRRETKPPHDPKTGEISEIHQGAMQPEGCAKVMRADSSMSESAVASGDAVRDASAMPLDVVAAPHSEGREHAGSAAAAPPACSDDIAIPDFLRRTA